MCSPKPGLLPPTLNALEREITELACHIHAATCRWLELVAEYDRRRGWAEWGCASCAHWVSWRCGVAQVAAREHVRVARRLEALPLVREAFAAGQLSYSKVRALARLEDVEREADLLSFARNASASQLERVVRAYRGVVAVERAARGGRPQRWVSWSRADDGSLLLYGRLPAEEGALVLAALDAAREHAADRRAREGNGAESLRPDRLVHDSAESPKRAERIDDSAGSLGPGGVVHDSAASLSPVGLAARDAEAEAPALDAGEARADALMLLADSFLAAGAAGRNGGDRHQVVVHLDAPTLHGPGRGEKCELDGGPPLASETARRLACDAAIVPLLERAGKPVGVGRKTRSIPPALRRALTARDRGCRFPGCTARRFVDAHHIHHWAHGGPTELSNLVHLCRHHHRLLHEGGYTLTATGKGTLTFRRPDGRPIPASPTTPGGRLTGIRPPGHRRPIAANACVPLSGDKLDLHLGVQALIAFAPIGNMPPGV
jgi:Domain of unknown function (DUF222)/HNH endonuclease